MPHQPLAPNEITFLADALDGPKLVFATIDDPMILDLVERGLIVVRSNADRQHALIDLTPVGKEAVQRDLRGHFRNHMKRGAAG